MQLGVIDKEAKEKMTIIEQLPNLDFISFLIGAGLILLALIPFKLYKKINLGKKDKTSLPGFKRLVRETHEFMQMANDNLIKLQDAFNQLENGE